MRVFDGAYYEFTDEFSKFKMVEISTAEKSLKTTQFKCKLVSQVIWSC